MSFISDLFSSGASDIIKSVGTAVDSIFTNDEEKQQLLNELKKIELNASIRSEELALEADKIMHKNTADARAMQVAALNQGDVFSKRFSYYLATFWSLAAAAYIYAITFMPIAEQSIRFADTILGFLLGTIVATIINYFFGSADTTVPNIHKGTVDSK